MTRDEVIRLAREAGFAYSWSEAAGEALERFAALVAKAEREACAALFDDHKIWDEEAAAIIRARGNV